jgi:tripartite-type tricarboxylate transporter receptor subunit TctC
VNWLRCGCAIAAVAAAVAFGAPTAALAQDYPTRPIRLVAVTAAGGLMDVAARVTAEYVGKALGQSIVIENRPGGGGNLGAEAIAKAPPDGYTIGLIQLGNVAINPHIYADMPFDPLNDLVPVAPVTTSPILVVANAKVAANDLRELIALAKQKPGQAELRIRGARNGAASCGRNVQGIGRRRHPARALSRGRAGRE